MKACHRVTARHNGQIVYFSPVISRQRAKAIYAREIETTRKEIAMLWPDLEEQKPGLWVHRGNPEYTYTVQIINTKHTPAGI